MNTSYMLVRAVRGPILLIALGSLMALHKFQDISFTKTWPVLLILLGLMKLFERMALSASATPASGPYVGPDGQL
ncbi:LiaI-LiaF-like domain-containing protein [Paludibaculum fermentans]|uniref:LiaI-LiaF-like domain-containing protein n=1 Tax=Paludibaculum fermentans TaxID=1473598 RepID=UPI003EBEB131